MAPRTGRRFTLRGGLVVLLALSIAPAVILGRLWKAAVERNSQPQSAEPFRIAGNFYYVGTADTSAFLITGPEGHVVLDAGDRSAPLIIASIARLGFAVKDVKLLINSEPHSAGGLAAPARVDHWFDDGETIRVGPIALTTHITAGSSRGCTSWSFQVRDGDRVLNVVSACSLIRVFGMRYPEQEADLRRSFLVLRSLPADIWVTGRSRLWGRYRKFAASATAKNPVDPFIDPEGYRAYIDSAEAELRNGHVH